MKETTLHEKSMLTKKHYNSKPSYKKFFTPSLLQHFTIISSLILLGAEDMLSRIGVWLVILDTEVEARETSVGLTKVTQHVTTAFLDVAFQSHSWKHYCFSRHSSNVFCGSRKKRIRNCEVTLIIQFTSSI